MNFDSCAFPENVLIFFFIEIEIKIKFKRKRINTKYREGNEMRVLRDNKVVILRTGEMANARVCDCCGRLRRRDVIPDTHLLSLSLSLGKARMFSPRPISYRPK